MFLRVEMDDGAPAAVRDAERLLLPWAGKTGAGLRPLRDGFAVDIAADCLWDALLDLRQRCDVLDLRVSGEAR